ncbi:MAG: glycoside hydrolase family 3 N-terminal domain-containing protein, partial [Spirochaetales bacterium]
QMVRWRKVFLIALGILACRNINFETFSSLPRIWGESTQELVATTLSSLSLEEKCATLLLIAFGEGRQVPKGFATRLRSLPVGGVLMFSYNIPKTAEELIDLTEEIRLAGSSRPPFIALDHEGGTVLRLRGIATELPDARVLGNSRAPEEKIRQLFRSVAGQIALLGITLNLAPVVEPLTEETRSFLGRRIYASDPEKVAGITAMFIEEMQKVGVVGVAKHFPGSGNSDPHMGVSLSRAKPSDLRDSLTLPFRLLLQRGLLPAIMVSHVMLPEEGVREPATLSEKVLTQILRNQWRYTGLVVTDDFLMKGLSSFSPPAEGVVRSIRYGTDLAMYLGSDYERVHKALVEAVRTGALPEARVHEAVKRIVYIQMQMRRLHPAYSSLDPKRRLQEFYRLKAEGDRLVQEIMKF